MTGTEGTEPPMAQTSSPTVWRRWLALELRRLRTEAEVTAQQAAKALRCTTTKISYMENAERGVQEADLDNLLDLYDVPDTRRDGYLQACRDSRRKGWWERYDELVPEWLSLYVGLEQGASRLRAYEPHVIHGLLQNADYAEALLRRYIEPRTDERVAQLVELRTTRQAALERDSDPLDLWLVLDEGALRRVVGSPAIMATQLRRVADAAERPNVVVQVLPFASGAHAGMRGPFALLNFPWDTDIGVAYVENHTRATYIEAPREIDAYGLVFQHLCALALPPDESIVLIQAAAEEYRHAA